MWESILSVVQIVLAIALVAVIMLQAPEGGLSPVFGGGGEMYRSKHNVEKFLIVATIVLAVTLALVSLFLVISAK